MQLVNWSFEVLIAQLEALLAPATPVSSNPGTFAAMVASKTASPSSATPPTPLHTAFTTAARQTGLSPALLEAVAHVESHDQPQAVSSAGAVGVMQLMPTTAQALGVNPYQAQSNILGGAEYLKQLLNQFHQNLQLSLAAYNAGPGSVEAYGAIPPYAQTQNYVRQVLQQLPDTPLHL